MFTVMKAFPSSESVQEFASAVLANLFDERGVITAADQLAEFARNIDTSDMEELLEASEMVRFLAKVPENIDVMVSRNAIQTLVSMIANISQRSDSESNSKCLAACEQALGNIATKTKLDAGSQAVPWILYALKKNKKNETLLCVQSICEDATNADEITKNGGIPAIVDIFMSKQNDQEAVTACLKALAELTNNTAAAEQFADADGVSMVLKWLEEHMEEATPEQANACIQILKGLARAQGDNIDE